MLRPVLLPLDLASLSAARIEKDTLRSTNTNARELREIGVPLLSVERLSSFVAHPVGPRLSDQTNGLLISME